MSSEAKCHSASVPWTKGPIVAPVSLMICGIILP